MTEPGAAPIPTEEQAADAEKDREGPLDGFSENLDAFHTLLASDTEAADDFLASLDGEYAEAE